VQPLTPLIWTIIEYLVVNIYPALYSPGNVLIPPPFWFAAWVGYLITFLNLLPIWQLDGGHISRALFGDRGHKVASAVGLIITFLGGYWFFGLLILLFMWRSKSAGPLDDVTPIANSKKALGILAYVILGLCFVMISPIF
jgi:membrane-associated protease RseP (regulator of RpoE activity)